MEEMVGAKRIEAEVRLFRCSLNLMQVAMAEGAKRFEAEVRHVPFSSYPMNGSAGCCHLYTSPLQPSDGGGQQC